MDVDPDEQLVLKFLVDEFRKLQRGGEMLDLGCGPCIHHVLPAVPYVSQITMGDIKGDNLHEIRKWKYKKNNSHDWNTFTKYILKLEGKSPSKKNIQHREDALRKKIRKICHADILKSHPLNPQKKFPVVGFFFCAEDAAKTKQSWRKIMRRVGNLVETNGALFMCSLVNAHFYTVRNVRGQLERIPCVRVRTADVEDILAEIGFTITNIGTRNVGGMKQYGISKIIVVSARKTG